VSRRLSAPTVYLVLEGGTAFFRTAMGTIFSVYLVLSAGLDPFQLVILGTALEGAVLLFEVPTGVVADTISRRTSVIIGMFVQGAGFVLMGLVPRFWPLFAAQVLWGFGFTFTSGADVAWFTDEVGEERAHRLYLRAAQVSQAAAMAGIGAGVGLAIISLGLPIVVCGVGLAALGVFLLVAMPETNFHRIEERSRSSFVRTFREGLATVRRSHALVLVLAVAAFHGLSTEGFDRLWTIHLIEGVGIPGLAGLQGELALVVWFGVLEAVGLLLAIGAAEVVRRRVDLGSHVGVARTLAVIDVTLVVAVVAFGLTGAFAVAVAAFWVISLLREVREPVFTAWVNQGLEPKTRATINSMASQMDAVGQIVGGPAIGWLALASVPAALVTAGLLRTPSLALFGRAIRRGRGRPETPQEPVEVERGELDITGMPGPPVG
jgi:DHA3 family tetracycline resistance protein-like MFS transporter